MVWVTFTNFVNIRKKMDSLRASGCEPHHSLQFKVPSSTAIVFPSHFNCGGQELNDLHFIDKDNMTLYKPKCPPKVTGIQKNLSNVAFLSYEDPFPVSSFSKAGLWHGLWWMRLMERKAENTREIVPVIHRSIIGSYYQSYVKLACGKKTFKLKILAIIL